VAVRAIGIHALLCAAVLGGTVMTLRAASRFEDETGATILQMELWPRGAAPVRKDDTEEEWRARKEAFRDSLRLPLRWDTYLLVPGYGLLLLTVGRRLARSRVDAARSLGRLTAWLSLAAVADVAENLLMPAAVDGGAVATLEALAAHGKWLLLLAVGVALPLGLARHGGRSAEAPTPWIVVALVSSSVLGILALALSPVLGPVSLVAQVVGVCGSLPVAVAAVGGFLIRAPDDRSQTDQVENVFR
jgi:hypothetical protein